MEHGERVGFLACQRLVTVRLTKEKRGAFCKSFELAGVRHERGSDSPIVGHWSTTQISANGNMAESVIAASQFQFVFQARPLELALPTAPLSGHFGEEYSQVRRVIRTNAALGR